jgi:DNA replication protein DnaC
MKLHAMLAAWEAQQQDPSSASLTFDERLALLIDAEWLARENRRLARALQEAKLRPSHACLEAVDYGPRRGLDKSQLRQLATCRWVADHQAVLIYGGVAPARASWRVR